MKWIELSEKLPEIGDLVLLKFKTVIVYDPEKGRDIPYTEYKELIMLHYPTLPKHKSKRKLKKYSHSKLRKDKVFCGIKVYTYNIGDYCYFTSKPKQKGAKAYPYKYALWLIRYYNGVMDRR